MTSSALLASVALSTVILLPMRQVGWLSASSTVARATCAASHSRNGPPDAVRISRASSPLCPVTHCSTALCSESTGTTSPPPCRAASATRSPAMTSDSLLASATRLPARSAASVASSPAAPTSALITMSTSGCSAASSSTSTPDGESVAAGPVDDAGEGRAPAGHLRQQALALPAGGERHDAEVIPLAIEHAQRALADRAGGAEHRDAARPAVRAVAHPGMPKSV